MSLSLTQPLALGHNRVPVVLEATGPKKLVKESTLGTEGAY